MIIDINLDGNSNPKYITTFYVKYNEDEKSLVKIQVEDIPWQKNNKYDI